MQNFKINQSKIRWSCRLENFGAGYYARLSKKYAKQKELSETFKTFSGHELKHGAMFRTFYQKEFGKKLNKNFWYSFGWFSAVLQFLIPLRIKLKMLSRVEASAVEQIKGELGSGERNKYLEILEKILPDEIAHAELYGKMYPA